MRHRFWHSHKSSSMCMGLGCNAVGVTGCRIISSPSERLAAIVTNTFMPCNGRFGLLIAMAAIFVGSMFRPELGSIISALFVLALIVLGTAVTLGITKLLSFTLLKGKGSSFALELPPYRRPQIMKTLARSVLDRTLCILGRALSVAAPAGAIIWLMANISIGELSVLEHCGRFLDPFSKLMGLDGYILLAFVLALPANEIVLPIILMCYLSTNQMVDIGELEILKQLLISHDWTLLTAINVMLFSLLHFPCATTLYTIKKETGSWKWTLISFVLPTLTGMAVCMMITGIWHLCALLF